MIVPAYWAESRAQERTSTRQLTVRRFGWSDESQEAAQRHADERARDALARALADRRVPRREPKVPYNGAHGVPIREQIVSRHDEVVITRNGYGARCLNTPNVLFADIDFEREPSLVFSLCLVALLLAAAVALGLAVRSWFVGVLFGIAAIPGGFLAAFVLERLIQSARGGPEKRAYQRIHAFVRDHADWHLRVYRTPAGLRVLVMHSTFDPADAAVVGCLGALGADPIYTRMCIRQLCFRARVSPKPWRIGIATHLRPRPGVWPIRPRWMAQRAHWIEAYEAAAGSYASCRFVEALGSKHVDATAAAVQRLHDELCRATSPLPIA